MDTPIYCRNCTRADRCANTSQHAHGCCCRYDGPYWEAVIDWSRPTTIALCERHAIAAEERGRTVTLVPTAEQAATRRAWLAAGIGAN